MSNKWGKEINRRWKRTSSTIQTNVFSYWLLFT